MAAVARIDWWHRQSRSSRYGLTPGKEQTSPLNVRRIGGVTMAENRVSTRPLIAPKPRRYKVGEGLVLQFVCHANSTHVLQTLALSASW